ncbi:MAG TPA: hypothetical protein VFI22_05325 [Thermomicrobiales bacterium]|nr:hypothetical protein [Thermomicrobiales bacterium]
MSQPWAAMIRSRSAAVSAALPPYIDIGSPLIRIKTNASSEIKKSNGTACSSRRTM